MKFSGAEAAVRSTFFCKDPNLITCNDECVKVLKAPVSNILIQTHTNM